MVWFDHGTIVPNLIKEDVTMGLDKLIGWRRQEAAPGSACRTACGASDKPAACGTADKPAACGAADKQ